MKTASSKAKGRKLQQVVRDKILDTYPILDEDDVRSTSMGAKGEDVLLSSSARKLFPYSVECKSRETIALYAWYQQAKANCPKDVEPMLVIKQNYSKPLVVVDLDHYFNLLERLK